MKFLAIVAGLLVASSAFAGSGPEMTTCQACTDIEDALYPESAWQLVSGSTTGLVNGEYAYEFCAETGGTYEFTFCHDGGTADYDTSMSIWYLGTGACDAGAGYLICNDDTCGLLSELVWTAATGGQYVLRVAGFGSSQGNYTLAYRGAPCAVPVEPSTWGAIKGLYE